jgi:hypothetical protein
MSYEHQAAIGNRLDQENPAVARDAPPDQRRELERFVAEVEAGTLPLSAAMRDDAEAMADVARLILQASGPDGCQEDLDALVACLKTAREPAPWARGWNEPGQWTAERVPRTANERGHKRAEGEGQRVARGWIGHAAVTREVAVAKPELNALVEPLLIYDQKSVTYVTARFLGATAIWPDGAEWPNPFADAPAWLQTAAEAIQPAFLDTLRGLATRIAEAGAPLDPADLGGWLVLAQLALLDVDLSTDLTKIVDDLNTWPPGWIDRDAAILGHVATEVSRHGRKARFQADLTRSAEVIARRLGPPPIRSAYAAGRRRSTQLETRRLRNELALLVERYPALTPASLLELVDSDDHPTLVELRTALGAKADWLPDRRRLERNWPKPRQ